MKIVYMGTPEFARRPLAALCDSEHQVVAVVTGRARRTGRGNELQPTAVYREAARRSLTAYTPASLQDRELHDRIRALEADLIVVVAFRVLPEELYTIPRYGSINIHASLLPRYRGAAPVNWALINGERETGLTSFFLRKQVDTGDIILQEKTAIAESDNFDSLYARLSELAGPFLLKSIALIEKGTVAASRQDDSQATPAPKIHSFDAMIDWGLPAEKVTNFVRGLSTRPGAYSFFREKKVKILACRVSDRAGNTTRPGTVIEDKKRLLVQCADATVEILTLLPEGKKVMDGLSFRNGFRPAAGELFGQITEKAEKN
jgi:methionyl-tRNA formyltransferase